MKLKDIRIQKGFTQRDIANYLGCAPSVYSRYETGDREPSLDVLVKIAHYLNVSVDFILGIETSAPSALNNYEVALINAARNADERAREDALNMLLSHSKSREGRKKKEKEWGGWGC